MSAPDMKQVQKILSYNAKNQYFGKFSFRDMNSVHGDMRQTTKFDSPTREKMLYIGHIDSDVIVRGLWNEMSYNPVRFGKKCPFLSVKDLLFRPIPANVDDGAQRVLRKIRAQISYFYALNNNMDEIKTTPDGYVKLVLRLSNIDGKYHSGSMYKMLACLRECIKLISTQNTDDLNDAQFQDRIIQTVVTPHPDLVRPTKPAQKIAAPVRELSLAAELAESRYDDAMDNLQITLDNASSVSRDQYTQALSDMNALIAAHAQHTI